MTRVETQVRLWGGRFAAEPAPELDRLNRSLPVDRRIWREDIAGSRAWVAALRGAGVVTPEEADALVAGLSAVGERLGGWSDADWASAPDEDIHALVERLLFEEAGPVAGKLHTGRSRNDQVATDTRMWGLGAARAVGEELRRLQGALVEQAERNVDVLLPSYTHLQRAQPVSGAHWLLSHFWPLQRDLDRLEDAGRRTAVLPLGSGAVAGCPFPVDRVVLKELLGFRELSPNSIDAVTDRDWVAELLFAASLLGVHLSRLAEDLIVYASAEFGFVRLDDRFSTGSSLMPQKRNPDALELARAKAGRLIGELTGFLAVLKGLPSGYNKDLQEDKTALFSAFDALMAVLPAVTGTVATLHFDDDRCAAALDATLMATDLADALVQGGMPFRRAHEEVGRLVRAAESEGCALDALDPEAVRTASPALAELPLPDLLEAAASVRRRTGVGGTAPGAVAEQLRHARHLLEDPAPAPGNRWVPDPPA